MVALQDIIYPLSWDRTFKAAVLEKQPYRATCSDFIAYTKSLLSHMKQGAESCPSHQHFEKLGHQRRKNRVKILGDLQQVCAPKIFQVVRTG